MPELLAFVLSLYPHPTELHGGLSLHHTCVQNGSLAALRAVLDSPDAEVSVIFGLVIARMSQTPSLVLGLQRLAADSLPA